LTWIPAFLWMALIFAISSIPDVGGVPGGFSDSTAHMGVYAVLGGLYLRALSRKDWRNLGWQTALAAIALSTLYGMSDEWHQSFVPGRTSEWRDVFSDAAGALLGASALWAWSIIRHFSRARERRHGVHEPPSRA
jgi:VanZ family protein